METELATEKFGKLCVEMLRTKGHECNQNCHGCIVTGQQTFRTVRM